MRTSVDDEVARWVANHRRDVIDEATLWMASASDLLGVLAVVGVVAVSAALWFGRWRSMVPVVAVLATVSVLTVWLKPVIDRPRPPADLALIEVTGSAMPSSQALVTAAIVVAVVMADWWSSQRLRRLALVGGSAGCMVIGAAMVYLGVHWLTDVLAGWILGAGLTWPLMRLLRSLGGSERPDG